MKRLKFVGVAAVLVGGMTAGLVVFTGIAGGQAGPLAPQPPPWGGVIYGLQNAAGADPSGMQIIGAIDSPIGTCTNFVPTTIGSVPSIDGYMSVWLDNHPSHTISFFGSRSPSIDGIPKIDRWVGVPGQQAFTLVTTWNTASGLPAQSITVLPAGPPTSLYVVSAEGPSIYT